MEWFGDLIALVVSIVALVYSIVFMISKKAPLFFQLITAAIGCQLLGNIFDVCEIFTTGTLAEGFTIGYLGTIGCFLFLLTANFGYMDGIMDDGTAVSKKSRLLALIAPAVLCLILIPNFFADIPLSTKVCYSLVWIPAMFSSYFNVKHLLIPDMDFGFVKAIRPYNLFAFVFTLVQLIHLTAWNFFGWVTIAVTGSLVGASCMAMAIATKKGVEGWKV